MRRVVICLAVLCAAVLLAPATGERSGPAIAGVVKDTTGAVMPGVTVEASSPALIEKTRVGRHRQRGPVQDRRPAARAPTRWRSRWPGSRPCAAAASSSKAPSPRTVNAELQVGAVEETLTVTARIADRRRHQQHRRRSSPNREVLDAIPTPIRNTPARALLIPGTTVTPFVLGQYNLTSHGSATSDFTMAIDGLRVNNLCGSGQYSGFYMNDAAVQELTYTHRRPNPPKSRAAASASTSVPKDGGNRFSGILLRRTARAAACSPTTAPTR